MGCRFYQPFRRTHRHGCMAGYHCLMPTALLSLCPHTQSIYISTLRPMTNLSTFPIAKYTAYQYFLLQFMPNLSAFFSMQPHTRYFNIPRCRKTIWCLHLSCNNTIFALKHLIYGKHLYPNLLTHHFRRS